MNGRWTTHVEFIIPRSSNLLRSPWTSSAKSHFLSVVELLCEMMLSLTSADGSNYSFIRFLLSFYGVMQDHRTTLEGSLLLRLPRGFLGVRRPKPSWQIERWWRNRLSWSFSAVLSSFSVLFWLLTRFRVIAIAFCMRAL